MSPVERYLEAYLDWIRAGKLVKELRERIEDTRGWLYSPQEFTQERIEKIVSSSVSPQEFAEALSRYMTSLGLKRQAWESLPESDKLALLTIAARGAVDV